VHDEYIKSIDTIIVDRKTLSDLNSLMSKDNELIVELKNNKLNLGTLNQMLGGYRIRSCCVQDCNKSTCGYSHGYTDPIPKKLADIYFHIHKKFNERRNEILRINYNNFLKKNEKECITRGRSIQDETYILKLEKELDSANFYIQDKIEKWEADSKYIIDLQNDLRELKRQNVSFQIQLINLSVQLESKDNLIAKLSEKINNQSDFDQYRQTSQYNSSYQLQLNEPQFSQYETRNYPIQPRENSKRRRFE
jgi:hypothetical protein